MYANGVGVVTIDVRRWRLQARPPSPTRPVPSRTRDVGSGFGGRIRSYAKIEDRAAAITAGYQQHAVKPIEPAELAAAVATLAGRETLARE
jgi:hypothetical protein